jgi:hypothetical protein
MTMSLRRGRATAGHTISRIRPVKWKNEGWLINYRNRVSENVIIFERFESLQTSSRRRRDMESCRMRMGREGFHIEPGS